MKYYVAISSVLAVLMFSLVGAVSIIKFAMVPAAVVLSTQGFKVSYFNNITLRGTPLVITTEKEIQLRNLPKGINSQEFSVRWEGTINLATAGLYEFKAETDDGMRIWVDGKRILNKWIRNHNTYTATTDQLSAGMHKIRVEYFQQWGEYSARVSYTLRDVQATKESTPKVANSPAKKPITPMVTTVFSDVLKNATTCNHERYAYNSSGSWVKFSLNDKTVCHDIVYSPQGLKLDLYLPNNGGSQNMPLIVWVHGGAFTVGGRFECAYNTHKFVDKGYAVACVSYRMDSQKGEQAPDEEYAPSGYFPENLKDIKTAIQYLRKNAGSHYNPSKIIIGGHSAGGYFATMVAATNDVKAFNGYGDASVSSNVQGALIYAGISDFDSFINHQPIKGKETYEDAKRGAQSVLASLLKGWPNSNASIANPIDMIDSSDVPMFIAHGTNDTLVPYEVAKILDKTLTSVKVPHALRTLRGGTHDSIVSSSVVFSDAVKWLNARFK